MTKEVAAANNSRKSAALYKEAVTKVTKEIATKKKQQCSDKKASSRLTYNYSKYFSSTVAAGG